LCNTLLTN